MNTKRLDSAFHCLNIAQFGSALNENFLKLLVILYLIGRKGPGEAGAVAAVAGGVFVLPFLLFSAWAGALADRWSKRRVVVTVKAAEVGVALLIPAAFASGREAPLYASLFALSTLAAFLSPSKYGIVPELVERERLSRANSVLEAATYLAIILGTGLAPLLASVTGGRYALASAVCAGSAAVGLAAALALRPTPAVNSSASARPVFLGRILRTLGSLKGDGYLLLAVIAAAYFLLLGAFVQLNLIPYGIQALRLPKEQASLLFFLAALGISAGSLLAGHLSGRNVEFGVVPLGALGLTVSSLALAAVPGRLAAVCPVILLFGISAGLFIVPLNAFIQLRSPAERRGEVLAASGFLGWVGVLLASGLLYLLGEVLGLSARQGFLALGVLTFGLTVASLWVLPDFLLRFLALLAMRLLYRIREIGPENVPAEGPALLVANHVSWLDALLLVATQQRRIRFLMEREFYETRWANPILRLMGVIPISTEDSPKRIVASLKEARRALDEGYLVCIFAEGHLTRTGMMREFRPGFERIVRGSDIPVIPVYIGGAWGSILSYAHGKLLSQLPRLFPYDVALLFGKPLPPTSTAADVREAVLLLSCDYFEDRKGERRPLGEVFVKRARENWGRRAIADTTGKSVTYGRALAGALALGRLLEEIAPGEERVGVLLPPSVGGALANLALTLSGRVPVNLNYTASAGAFRSAIDQCDLRTVVTSRAFLERFPNLPLPEGVVCLEDLLPRIGRGAKLAALLRARFLPRRLIAGPRPFDPDALATILFSSGSTGEPKGVMLSHHNLLSSVEALRMVFRTSPHDNICGALPFFHSFGFSATLWLPLLSGFSATYHPNPLEAAKIAEVVRESRSTILPATPTFLLSYLRRAKPEDFKTLRLVMVGAEKLQERLAEAFHDKFGLWPLEGYGATELAPVATVSVPDVEVDGVRQVGSRPGRVGHPIPGVAVRIVDPDTGAVLPQGEQGLLLVKGPNVMLGYWNRPDKTAEVLRDGWYVTGDIASLDPDGFVAITDRLSRFSKIGGEMVPHLAVEEVLQKGLGRTDAVVAVASVPDEKRGERLVVLHTPEAGDPDRLRAILEESPLPNLWKPGRDAYVLIEAMPLLGTGKLDLKGLKELALAAA
jgi:acyl-[acyl-carrier-protein]-phospholipid O-acyltransferase/long-chain-fatty-acid--[acyl-carrier-protein] ligase